MNDLTKKQMEVMLEPIMESDRYVIEDVFEAMAKIARRKWTKDFGDKVQLACKVAKMICLGVPDYSVYWSDDERQAIREYHEARKAGHNILQK